MNDTYCKRANHELILRSFNNDVEAALCCKSQHPVSLFDRYALQKVKEDLNNGIKNTHCNVCWYKENNGIPSWRQIGNDLQIYGKSIEIYFDNTCDQACIYCSPKYSSKWFQEIKHATSEDKKLLNNFINDRTFKQTPRQNNKIAIMQEIANVGSASDPGDYVAIVLLGGEPLLSQQFDKTNILKEIVETFYLKANEDVNLLITIVTNANTPDTIIDQTIKTSYLLLKKYSKLQLTVQLSIESIEKNAEFIRYGLDYNQFLKNIKKYLESNITVGFSMAVNTVSFIDTPNFLNTVFSLCKKYNNYTFFNFNLVDYPEFLSIKTLPKTYQYILDQCRDIFNSNIECFYKDSLYKRTMIQLDHAETKLGTELDQKHYDNAKKYFSYIEKSRNKKLKDVNIDLYNFLMDAQNE